MGDRLIAHGRQFTVFVIGGVLCALVDIGVMHLMLKAGAHFTSAATFGFVAGLALNYAFHSKVTFAGGGNRASPLRYASLVALNYLITIGVVALAVRLDLDPLAGKVASLPLVAVNGFLLGKYWVFK